MPPSDRSRCSFRLDLTDADGFPDLEGEEWRCPRPVHDEYERCLFHLSPDEHDLEPDVVRSRFRAILRGDTDTPRNPDALRFIGAHFDRLNLSHAVLDGPDTYPIDFREATIAGELDLSNARLGHPILASRTTFRGPVRFTNCETRYDLDFEDATFEGSVVFDDADLEALDCEGASIGGVCRGRRLTANGPVNFGQAYLEGFTFEEAKIDGQLYLRDVHCERRGRIDGATVSGVVSFSRSQFRNGIWGAKAEFGDGLNCNDTQFDGPVHFHDVTFGGVSQIRTTGFGSMADFRNSQVRSISFNPTSFVGEARFDDSRFETVSFEDVTVADSLSLEGSTIEEAAHFRNVSFPSKLNCRGADIGRLKLESPTTTVTDRGVVDLREATIDSGQMGQTADGIYYDLERARVGDVTIDEGPSGDPLRWYRFLRTNFDGFDFSSHKFSLDESSWRLYSPSEARPTDEFRSDPSPVDLEVTYLKAKNGASVTGDSEAASQFYRKEMYHRRQKYLSQVTDDPRPMRKIKAGFLSVYNLFMDITTGHGEIPRRVVGSSGAIILLFSILYWSYFRPPLATGDGLVDYLVLSAQIFLTFILGTNVETSSIGLALTAAFEGFLGAFFIALFVFTITRSIKR